MDNRLLMQRALIAGYPIVLPEHRATFHREHPDWERDRIDAMRQVIKPDSIICDVGAEQGDISALLGSWVPEGGMILVEVQSDYWPNIRTTFEANDLAPPKRSFVGFAGRTEQMNDAYTHSGWPPESEKEGDTEAHFFHLYAHPHLPCRSLDSFITMADVITMDVEGAELWVLQGAVNYLDYAHPTVFVSFHPDFAQENYGYTESDLDLFMFNHGYDAETITVDHEVHKMYR